MLVTLPDNIFKLFLELSICIAEVSDDGLLK
jgi:hypothetical protein